jgi:hypothetical protein
MMRSKTPLTFALLASTALSGPVVVRAGELPTGGSVAYGAVSIATPSPGAMTIRQSSQAAIVNWQGFSVGQGNSVAIQQPSSSAALLNRVTGTTTFTVINRAGASLLGSGADLDPAPNSRQFGAVINGGKGATGGMLVLRNGGLIQGAAGVWINRGSLLLEGETPGSDFAGTIRTTQGFGIGLWNGATLAGPVNIGTTGQIIAGGRVRRRGEAGRGGEGEGGLGPGLAGGLAGARGQGRLAQLRRARRDAAAALERGGLSAAQCAAVHE